MFPRVQLDKTEDDTKGLHMSDPVLFHFQDGLVVADASILPFVPRANTNLSAILVGEMMGEWLRTGPGRYGL